MSTEEAIESYLAALDKALGPIPTSDRADIITEIKSHILEAKSRDRKLKTAKVLASFGEPETVASRYLAERGLPLAKPPKSPIIKWLMVGCLGTVALVCGTFLMVVYLATRWFSPSITVDEKDGHVNVGGVIDVDGKTGRVKIGSKVVVTGAEAQVFEGAQALVPGQLDSVELAFVTGEVSVAPSSDGKLHWKFDVVGATGTAKALKSGSVFRLDMASASTAAGELRVPAGLKVRVQGVTGEIAVRHPQAPTEISLVTGDIKISPDKSKKYRYETHVTTGDATGFESSDAKDAIRIKATLVTGDITRD